MMARRREQLSLSIDHADSSTEFSRDEFDEAYPPGYELHYWQRARGGIIRDLVRAFCSKGDTILEIGAARGHYVRLLRAPMVSTPMAAIPETPRCMRRCAASSSVKPNSRI
jgi:hypothetical protein